jgi:hypothetical protein
LFYSKIKRESLERGQAIVQKESNLSIDGPGLFYGNNKLNVFLGKKLSTLKDGG